MPKSIRQVREHRPNMPQDADSFVARFRRDYPDLTPEEEVQIRRHAETNCGLWFRCNFTSSDVGVTVGILGLDKGSTHEKQRDDLCAECGLPISICNSLVLYTRAVSEFRRGNVMQAEDYAASAKEYHDLYVKRFRANGRLRP